MSTEPAASTVMDEGTAEAEARFLAALNAEETDQPDDSASEPESAPDADEEAPDTDSASDEPGDETPVPEATKKWNLRAAGSEQEVDEPQLVELAKKGIDYTKKTMALAEEQRQVVAQRAAYVERLNAVEAILTAQAGEPDWGALRESLPPEEYAARYADFSVRQAGLQKFQAERQREAERFNVDQAHARENYVATQRDILREKVPAWRDDTKSKAAEDAIVAFATEMGYSPEELNRITDHRDILVLHKAAQFDKLEKKIKLTKPSAAPTQTSVKPSQPRAVPRLAESKAKAELQTARRELKATGSQSDAEAAFMALLD